VLLRACQQDCKGCGVDDYTASYRGTVLSKVCLLPCCGKFRHTLLAQVGDPGVANCHSWRPGCCKLSQATRVLQTVTSDVHAQGCLSRVIPGGLSPTCWLIMHKEKTDTTAASLAIYGNMAKLHRAAEL
jgi:hypothetical protein